MTEVTNALNQPDVSPRLLQQTALEVVELYPYIEYMKYPAAGIDHAGDVRVGDDRRGHAVYRR